jgi:hypothetical protein
MSLTAIENPFDVILGLDGKGLNAGKVYVGVENQDPETDPQAVYWDADGTIPATQPLDTIGGYIWRSGTPTRAYVLDNYSIRVRDRFDNQVYYAASVQAGLVLNDLTFLQSGTGAVPRGAQDKMREALSVTDFGATGDGATDDTAAIQAADTAAAGRALYFPPGTYMINGTGIAKGNASWYGPGGRQATLKAMAVSNTTGELILGVEQDDVEVTGLAFDISQMTSPAVNRAALAFRLSDRLRIHANSFLGFPEIGIALNACNGYWVADNYLEILTAKNTQNQAILCSTASGASVGGVIEGNTCIGSAINLSGNRIRIANNYVTDWKFGGGVTTEQDANTYDLVIEGNVLVNGTGVDVNATACMGVENWALRSVIRGNICVGNAGDGINNGGQDCVVSGNVCNANGLQGPGYAGIASRYGDVTYNGRGSVITGNKCAGQSYGYIDQNASLAGITLSGNNFNNNTTGQTNIQGGFATHTCRCSRGLWRPRRAILRLVRQ